MQRPFLDRDFTGQLIIGKKLYLVVDRQGQFDASLVDDISNTTSGRINDQVLQYLFLNFRQLYDQIRPTTFATVNQLLDQSNCQYHYFRSTIDGINVNQPLSLPDVKQLRHQLADARLEIEASEFNF